MNPIMKYHNPGSMAKLIMIVMPFLISIHEAFPRPPRRKKTPKKETLAKNYRKNPNFPKLIVFDLDGCLWKPELYNLAWRGGKNQSPFHLLGDGSKCQSRMGSVVSLFPDVRYVLQDLSGRDDEVALGISSRTQHKDWAEEIVSTLTLSDGKPLNEVLTAPWEIKDERKTLHFERFVSNMELSFEDMVFFDDNAGNCKQISRLGVTVGYCPKGLSREIYERTLMKYPTKWGVVGLEIE
mmetsp:Transcript_1554/g.2384  ORF Transcript_1554/g.2384 Transcript_1554/m.2384 type:complete len:238 (+) Transcript_1554:99-812(+)